MRFILGLYFVQANVSLGRLRNETRTIIWQQPGLMLHLDVGDAYSSNAICKACITSAAPPTGGQSR